MELNDPLARVLGMGRPHRIHFPGAISHAMSKGNDSMPIFENYDDCIEFLVILADVKMRTGLIILAYCLMTTHFHLLAAVAQCTLGSIMQQVLSRYSHWFNWRRERHGHVFQDRYKAKLCLDDSYLSQVLPYIHRNPVNAGIVADPADWRWSSHRQFVERPRSTLLDLPATLSKLGDTPEKAMRRYHELMGTPSDWEPDYDEYELEPQKTGPIIRPTLDEIAAITERQTGLCFLGKRGAIRDRPLSAARRLFAQAAVGNGYAQREVARFMGLSTSAVHGLARSAD